MALRPSQLRASAQEAALLIPAAAQLQRLYGALEVPALIVAGAQDRYVDHVRHSVELSRRLPRSELMLSPRAGHMVHHTDPRRVLQAIEAAAR
jgi:pimeloyl-ACP methyl ester carboxylesterase